MGRVGVDYIRQGAQQRGLDPNASIAVASQEGLAGGVGDNGTSFGPFQLHYGGALPRNIPLSQAQEWAWSPAGINYAFDKQASVARGLKGNAAINAIVTRFERPANPQREIQGAIHAYGNSAGFKGIGPSPRAEANNTQALVKWALSNSNSFLNGGEGAAIPLGLFNPKPARHTSAIVNGVAGNPMVPLEGKIIGTPYHGTHDKSFNERGGSDNWESENAIDVAAPIGTPVRAITDGRIGDQFGALGGGRFAGYRLHLQGSGNEYYYGHLSRYADGIKPGTMVKAGQVIGYSGEANGVGHLHLASAKGNPLSIYGGA